MRVLTENFFLTSSYNHQKPVSMFTLTQVFRQSLENVNMKFYDRFSGLC